MVYLRGFVGWVVIPEWVSWLLNTVVLGCMFIPCCLDLFTWGLLFVVVIVDLL